MALFWTFPPSPKKLSKLSLLGFPCPTVTHLTRSVCMGRSSSVLQTAVSLGCPSLRIRLCSCRRGLQVNLLHRDTGTTWCVHDMMLSYDFVLGPVLNTAF